MEKTLGLSDGLVTGQVVYLRREVEGPCPVVYQTPFGEMHARLNDDDLFESLFREQLQDEMYNHPQAHVFERDALAGSQRTLRRFTPKMALCVYHREDDAEVIPRVVNEIHPEYRSSRTNTLVYFYP